MENPNSLIPLMDAMDHEILMHKEVHFSGSFAQMLGYYESQTYGLVEDFEIERITKLNKLEIETSQSLSAHVLFESEMEDIDDAIKTYDQLREIAKMDDPTKIQAILIAKLILSLESAQADAIQAIAYEGRKMIAPLIELLFNENYRNSLYPGFGLVPRLAIRCLSEIGGDRAIKGLFEALGRENFQNEELILSSLKDFGDPARDFLLWVAKSTPITQDNEKAAIALVNFSGDERVAEACLSTLMDSKFLEHPLLATYLILSCEGLREKKSLQKFSSLLDHPSITESLCEEIRLLEKSFASV
jgi:hypothetical protein